MQLFKLINTKFMLMAFTGLILFVSCQEGYDNIKEPDKSIAISENDNIADLILKVVLKDGSYDNIIDGCSEISIKYPYTIKIGEESITVNSLKDVESVAVNYFSVRNDIEINYPVTVSYSDYSEAVVSSGGQLKSIQKKNNANLIDDDIESIDFVYPIEISLYNKKYQKTDLIVAKTDKDIHKIFRNMNDIIVELNFPLVAKTKKERLTIDNNISLKKEIDEVKDSEDEDDKVEFSDDDYPYKSLLTLKKWKVMQYIDNGNKTSLFESFVFDFKKDNTIHVDVGGEIIIGEWELDVSDGIKQLELEFDIDNSPLEFLNEEWKIVNNSSVIINMEAESDDRKKFIIEEVAS